MRLTVALFLASACFGQQATTGECVFGFLRPHPERKDIPAEESMEIQKRHMAHLTKMAKDGILVGAGPLVDSPDLRGVVIFRGISIEQARRAAEQDPAVVAKRLKVDGASWRGPASIGEAVVAWQRANPGQNLPMAKRTLVVYWRTAAFPAQIASPADQGVLSGHVAFVGRLDDVLAVGPMQGSQEFVSVAVFAGEDPARAVRRRKEDPVVKAGWVRPQGFVWYVAEATFTRP